MLDRNRYDRILEKYEQECEEESRNAVSWCAIGGDEILVKMRNGDRSVYNERLNASRYISRRGVDEAVAIDDGKWRVRFGQTLKHRLYARGLTARDLAELTGISYATLHLYLNGKTSPSGPNISRIARALDCSVSELMYFDD